MIFITCKSSKEEICSELTKRWDVDVYVLQAKKKQLIITTKEWYFPVGHDKEKVLSLWKKVTDEAISNGKNGFRVFTDTAEIFDNSLEFHFYEYKCQFEQTFRIPMTAVCAYSVSNIDQYSADDYRKLLDHHIVNVTQ
ncbi:MAG: MEDS domain-containing protein [Nitrosopumilus sp.]